jgi:hypothetical protein
MKAVKIILTLTAALFGLICLLYPALQKAQTRTTQTKDQLSNWRPFNEARDIKYVGTQTCLQCHSKDAQTQSPMAHASLRPADSEVLKANPVLKFKNGSYSYELAKRGDEVVYTVTDGANKISEPIAYCFGEGQKGQVYIFYHNGQLYESKVTFYKAIQALDFTVAQTHEVPKTLDDAIGRPIPADEALNCFSCHSTASVHNKVLKPAELTPGISCEVCHGPGGNHVKAFKDRDLKNLQIYNPAKLPALELSQEFCGTCHVGFEKVLSMEKDVETVRFQPYRLFNSPKHDTNDARLSCVACHDPHQKTVKEPTFYDAKCFACHLSTPKDPKTRDRNAPACPVAKQNCVSCHMPKTDVAEMHFKFTDHTIRIVKPAGGDKIR